MNAPAPLAAAVARVVRTQHLTPNIMDIRLEMEEPAGLSFRAGQFIQLIIAPRILRQYSICSPPSERHALDLCVDVSPGGEGSRYVADLRVGDPVRFRGPFGLFVVPDTETRPIEFVATGAGIAPIRSMIAHALEQPEDLPIRLLFGNSVEGDVLYDAEFRARAEQHPRFVYVPTLSRPAASWGGERGRVIDVLERRPDVAGRPFFLCGSPAMVDDTRRVLEGKSVHPQDIHFEKFF